MKTLFALLLLNICFHVQAQLTPEQQLSTSQADFIENANQWNSDVLFKTGQPNMHLWLMKDKIRFDYFIMEEENEEEEMEGSDLGEELEIEGHIWDMQFLNIHSDVHVSGEEKNIQYYNYFIGTDRSHWATRVASYKEVWYHQLYDNIDARYYVNNKGNFEFDYIISPGGNADNIKLKFNGLTDYRTDSENNLLLVTTLGEVMQSKPIAWQIVNGKKEYIDIVYTLIDSVLSFAIQGRYNASETIIIDPELFQSTFLTCADCFGYEHASCLNADGSITICGFDFSASFPTTTGSYDTTLAGNTDVIVSRMDVDLTALVFSTFIGGPKLDDAGTIINIDESYYVIAGTADDSFPVTDSAYQTEHIPSFYYDGFVSGLSIDGDSLLFSTYMGTPNEEKIWAIAADSSRNIYGTGFSKGEFIVTDSVVQHAYGGGESDAIVFKLNPDASDLLFSTYLGGDGDDEGHDLIIKSGKVYIAGFTEGNFLITDDAYQTEPGGYADDFVTCLDTSGRNVFFSTYLGGWHANGDMANCIDVNDAGKIFVGSEAADGFPTTADAYQTECGGSLDFAISVLSPDGSELLHSTLIGGPQPDWFNGFAMNKGKGDIYILGWNWSGGFPLTDDAFDDHQEDYECVFVIMNQDLDSLIYSTYFGGDHDDYNPDSYTKPLFLENCYLYTPVTTHSLDFPVTPDAFQTVKYSDSGYDGPAIIKWYLGNIEASFLGENIFACSGDVVSLDAGAGYTDYSWSTGDTTAIIYPTESGVYNVTVDEFPNCSISDKIKVTFYPAGSVDIGNDTTLCKGESLLLSAEGVFDNYLWSTAATTPAIIVYDDDMYTLIATDTNGCEVSDTVNVHFEICDAIENNHTDPVIQIFPNPATNEIIINLLCSVIPEKIELQIYSVNNELIKEQKFTDVKIENTWKLDISDLPSSSFYIVLKAADALLVKKLIKL